MNNIYIVDAVSLLFRSYYAIRGMTNPKGESTGALFGFIRSIYKIIHDFDPDHFVAVFDGPDNKKSRTDLYEKYKAHRTGMPEDLFPQLQHAIAFCDIAGIPNIAIPGIEADDTIGAIAKWSRTQGAEVFLCSGDKDLCQLIDAHTTMIHTHKDNKRIDAKAVEALYGVPPSQMIDYLAIVGDTSDNIPGLSGFGPKTAAELLREMGTLETILDNPDRVKGAKKQQTIQDEREQALLSKKLATIDTSVDIPKEVSFYKRAAHNTQALAEFYSAMHFESLLKELDASIEKPASKRPTQCEIIQTEKQLADMLEKLTAHTTLCIDVETTSLNPMNARLVGIGIAAEPDEGFYIPWNGNLSEEVLRAHLHPFFAEPKRGFCGHNIKYDLHALANHGLTIATIAFDTMIASYLINPQNNRHNLDDLTLQVFNTHKTPISDLIGSGKKQKSMLDIEIDRVAPYCCEDVAYTLLLKHHFEPQLAELQLEPLFYTMEMPLLPILLNMERTGIYLNTDKLREKSKDLNKEIATVAEKIHELAGEDCNINSPKQLSRILFEKLGIPSPSKKGSTRADLLEELAPNYPIVQLILHYRTMEKLRSTYVDALPKQINERTGRIHCSFNQSVTATGRLSSTNPNLQNIPRRAKEGRFIRAAFQPQSPEASFLSADYSQIELRLMAHMSGEEKLIDAFQQDEDVHQIVAAKIFDVPLSEVTHAMRTKAKTVNFGIMYGQQAYGLSKQLGIAVNTAKDFIATYFEKYPKVQTFIQRSIEKVQKEGAAYTLFGRRRPIPEIHSKNAMLRSGAERLAVNTPLQGSQADIIKKAMIELSSQQLPAHMLLQIHDELIFEVADSEITTLTHLVRSTMESIIELKVPLKVNIAVGKNWGEC